MERVDFDQYLQQLREEVEFWERLIEWWEENNHQTAGPRLQRALQLARDKLARHQGWIDNSSS